MFLFPIWEYIFVTFKYDESCITCLFTSLIKFNTTNNTFCIFSFTTNPTNDDYFMSIYIKSHTRAGPYIVGAIFGYLLYRRKESTTKLNLVRYMIK